jgi:hypothetical protein
MLSINLNKIRFISFLYLFSSFFIFCLTWIKPYLSIFYCAIIIWSIVIFWKDTFKSQINYIKISYKDILIFSVILIVWIGLSGVGGLGTQTGDYVKHNALSYDLIKNPFPTKYQINGRTYFLTHYFGYYLTPAFLGRFVGWNGFNYINIVWTSAGILLSAFWLIRLVNHKKWYVFLMFILFGGFRLAGSIVQYGLTGTWELIYGAIYGTNSLFALNSLIHSFEFIYHNNTDLIYWSPQHTIGAWIGTGLFLEDWLNKKSLKVTSLYISVLAFWSPWTFIGLVPFMAVAILQLRDFRKWFYLPSAISGICIFILTAVFLLGVTGNKLVNHFIFTNNSISGASNTEVLKSYVFFIFFEVLIYALPILFIMYIRKNERFFLMLLTTIILVLIPLYRYGQWNDWCAKVSVPAQFILGFMVIDEILRKSKISKYLLIVFLLSSIVPVTTIINSFRYARHFSIPNYPDERSLLSLPNSADACACWPKEQFIASKDSFFFKYLAK